MKLKGVVRFVTPEQEMWDRLAQIGFIGGLAIGFGTFLAEKRLEKRNSGPKN